MTRAHEFTAKVKVAAFERSGGRCEECTAPLFPGKFRYDHRVPVEMGGESTLANCQCLCSSCDRRKTYGTDIPAIAKAKRIERKRIGAHRPKARIPGSRGTPFRKKLNGEVVRREWK